MDKEYEDFIKEFSESFNVLISELWWPDPDSLSHQPNSLDSIKVKHLLKIPAHYPVLNFSPDRKSGIFLSFIIKGEDRPFSMFSQGEKKRINFALELTRDHFHLKKLIRRKGESEIINDCSLDNNIDLANFSLSVKDLAKLKSHYYDFFPNSTDFKYNLT